MQFRVHGADGVEGNKPLYNGHVRLIAVHFKCISASIDVDT
jgi:hypothetical protein